MKGVLLVGLGAITKIPNITGIGSTRAGNRHVGKLGPERKTARAVAHLKVYRRLVENGYERGPCKGIASLGIGYGQLNRIGSRVKIGGGWIFQGGSSSVSKIPEPAGHSSGGKILEINYQGCAACSR